MAKAWTCVHACLDTCILACVPAVLCIIVQFVSIELGLFMHGKTCTTVFVVSPVAQGEFVGTISMITSVSQKNYHLEVLMK